MIDFVDARNRMVEEQLVKRGIKDQKVLDAMRKVERHRFVSEEYLDKAYDDMPLPINFSQTISQPYMVALMTELLELKGNEKVLEVGTGSGYQTAILGENCRYVYSIERHPGLVQQAEKLLKELGYQNIFIKVGNGTLGWSEHAPYDGIIVTAGAPEIPKALIEQLTKRGRMVIPIGPAIQQELMLVIKDNDSFTKKSICSCIFVPLIGKEGWDE